MQAKGFYDKPIEPFDAISQYETRNNQSAIKGNYVDDIFTSSKNNQNQNDRTAKFFSAASDAGGAVNDRKMLIKKKNN